MNQDNEFCNAIVLIGGPTLLLVISEIMPFINTIRSNGIFHSIYIVFQKYRKIEQELDLENNIFRDEMYS